MKLDLWKIGAALIKAGVALKDADAVCSGNPDRIRRRVYNRLLGQGISKATSGLYQRGGKRK